LDSQQEPLLAVPFDDGGGRRREHVRMSCAHCRREVAGVAVIFPGKPAVCGRADCLGWARALELPPTIIGALSAARPAGELRPAA